MCFHSKQTKLALEVENRFNAKIEKKELFQSQENINGFNFGRNPIITDEKPNIIQHYNWGLIPSWAKDPKIGAKMINARAETLSEKPSFRAAFKRRRCLMLADGFYEWKKLAKGKQPMHFSLQDHQPFGCAGLWEHWQSAEGSEIESCTVITTAANDLMRPVHDRMPVILAPQDYDAWLDPQSSGDRLQNLLRPYAAAEMAAYPVSTQVNNPQHETPDCIAPLEVNPSDAAHDDPAPTQNSR